MRVTAGLNVVPFGLKSYAESINPAPAWKDGGSFEWKALIWLRGTPLEETTVIPDGIFRTALPSSLQMFMFWVMIPWAFS